MDDLTSPGETGSRDGPNLMRSTTPRACIRAIRDARQSCANALEDLSRGPAWRQMAERGRQALPGSLREILPKPGNSLAEPRRADHPGKNRLSGKDHGDPFAFLDPFKPPRP